MRRGIFMGAQLAAITLGMSAGAAHLTRSAEPDLIEPRERALPSSPSDFWAGVKQYSQKKQRKRNRR